jgi:hypothetical protein
VLPCASRGIDDPAVENVDRRDGEVGYLDIGDAVVIVPGGVEPLRRAVLAAVSDDEWRQARAGFGDPDLASE